MRNITYEYIGQDSSIQEIPESLAKSFWYEAGGSLDLVHSSPIKLVALRTQIPVGFVTGDYSDHLITANSFYVDKEHRGAGIGKVLLLRLISKAKRENLEGIRITEMTTPSIACVSSLQRKCLSSKLVFDINDGEHLRYASITFP